MAGEGGWGEEGGAACADSLACRTRSGGCACRLRGLPSQALPRCCCLLMGLLLLLSLVLLLLTCRVVRHRCTPLFIAP